MIHPLQLLIIPPLLKAIWIKSIGGLENIPKDGRFIVTPNHQSYFDDWITPSIIVPYINKELHMYSNRKYFKNPIFRWYLNHHKAIPVEVYGGKDKKEINERAFQTALEYLKNNEPICIYPEGHRSPDGQLQKGKSGAAKLAIAAKVPILPIGIIGSRDVLSKGKSFPKLKKIIKISIGKPIYLKQYYGKENDKTILNIATTLIMKEIGKLANLEYEH